MVRKSAPVRYVRPDQTRIGDTVRVTFRNRDCTYTRVGTIGRRGTHGNRTEALTDAGMELFSYAGSTTEPEAIKITLLNRTDNESEYLF